MKIYRRFVLPGIFVSSLLGLSAFSAFAKRKDEGALISADGTLSCSSAQYDEYMKIMVIAGEMTIGQVPPFGGLAQQRKLLDEFEALRLQEDKTVIAVGHYPTGKVYTKTCKEERCTHLEMAEPEHACLTEYWNDCTYIAMQFRSRKYCFLEPAGR